MSLNSLSAVSKEKAMKNPFAVFLNIVGAAFITMAVNAWARADSPIETIRTTIQQARAVLEDPNYQGQDHKQQRLAKVKEIVLPQFDSQEVAKRTLSTHWKGLTEQQQQEFVNLFMMLVEKTYSHNLDRYNKNVQFFYDNERIEDKFSEVDTRVLDPVQNRTFSIGYRLHNVNGKWLVYDVVIENVSMVQNYRNQFNRILSKSSYEDLIKTLQNKLQELDTVPTTDSKG
jgi:phospholipid transport system substrate-binding protein